MNLGGGQGRMIQPIQLLLFFHFAEDHWKFHLVLEQICRLGFRHIINITYTASENYLFYLFICLVFVDVLANVVFKFWSCISLSIH